VRSGSLMLVLWGEGAISVVVFGSGVGDAVISVGIVVIVCKDRKVLNAFLVVVRKIGDVVSFSIKIWFGGKEEETGDG